MLVVPLQAIPNQSLQSNLNGQPCQLNVYQTLYGLFIDVYVNGVLIIGGVICLNFNRIVRNLYLGFSGDLFFWDTQGASDPVYTGLASRYLLVYAFPSEIQDET